MKRTLFTLLLTACGAVAGTPGGPADRAPAIIAEAFGKLSTALTKALASEGPAGALPVCATTAPAIAAGTGKAHGVTLRRATDKPRNPNNAVTDEERKALSAFAASLAKKEAPEPQLITNPDGSVSYLAPIIIPGALCLQCHGNEATDIAPETLAAIRKLYPQDKATGYKTGDLRGLWRVTFPAPPPPPASTPKPNP